MPANRSIKLSLALLLESLVSAFPPGQWKQVENSVDRALAWIASRQNPDGSFPTYPSGQPAVTSFCVLAFFIPGPPTGAWTLRPATQPRD